MEWAQVCSGTDGAPGGGTYWDNTLVLCCTEFARDNTFPDTGWNNGGGADHQGTNASRLISMPMMGGMMSAGETARPDGSENLQGCGCLLSLPIGAGDTRRLVGDANIEVF